MGVLKKSTPQKSETKVIPDEKDGTAPFVEPHQENLFEAPADQASPEGQLSVDVFQTATEIVVVAPVAGITLDDLSITVTDGILTIKGRRNFQFTPSLNDYFTQECFWGPFSRSIILPESVDTTNVAAFFKNGILCVRIPKMERIRTRIVKIREE